MATENLKGHIDRLREKPEHVRHQIAFGLAAGLTSLVAVGWGIALTTSGALAINSDVQPQAATGPGTESLSESLKEPAENFSNLVGAAGAAFGATSSEAALRVIDSRTSSTLEGRAQSSNATDKTVIPF